MSDATFEEGAYSDRPLRLSIESAEDLQIASALLQDAVGLAGEITWMPRRRRLAILVNRFRWEDREPAEEAGRRFERVRSALVFDSVVSVRARGLAPDDGETIYALLAMTHSADEDGRERILLTIAGDGELALDVDCIDARLIDLTQPWEAKSATAPKHEIE